jgi:enoyl-CoA hydratase/carnithine racemase
MRFETDVKDLVLINFYDQGQDGRIARVTFKNPQKRNALGADGKQHSITVMTELRHDESLRIKRYTLAKTSDQRLGADIDHRYRENRYRSSCRLLRHGRATHLNDAVRE